jgi:hypothetical protein
MAESERTVCAWAEYEIGHANFGDARLSKRAPRVLARLMAKPMALIPEASADWAEAKATYRFMDNEKVEQDAIVAAHRARTLERASQHPVVLAIGDTAMLDYSAHLRTTGLGPLADIEHHGLLLHPTLLVTPELVPQGLLDHYVWTREEATFANGDKTELAKRHITEKESYKWMRSLEAAEKAQEMLRTAGADTKVISVFDREGDVYEVLARASTTKCGLIVRSMNDRRVDLSITHIFRNRHSDPPLKRHRRIIA